MSRRDDERLLLDVALRFGATLDLDQLLPLVLERATQLFKAERGLFALLDSAGRVQRAVVHNLDWAGPGEPLPVSQSLLNRVLQSREPVVVADAETDSLFQRQHSVRILGLRFMVGIPVFVRDDVAGVLYVDSRAHVVKDLKEEVELLTAVARLVGTAVENARLFEAQRYRTMLLAQLVHDFRTPLSVIIANGQMLNLVDRDDLEEMADDITASAQRMARMIDNTLELSRADAGASCLEPVPFDLREELPMHVRGLHTVTASAGLSLEVDVPADLPAAYTMADRVWIILDNLLFNAVKNAEQGTVVRLTARCRDDAGPEAARQRPVNEAVNLFRRYPPLRADPGAPFVEVTVSNHGPPIPPSLIGALFTEYVHGQGAPRGIRPTGLGLSIADQCSRHLGGLVWLERSEAGETEFSFTLPTRLRDAADLTPAGESSEDDSHGSDTVPMPVVVR